MRRCSGPAGSGDGRCPRSSSGVALNRRLPVKHTGSRQDASRRRVCAGIAESEPSGSPASTSSERTVLTCLMRAQSRSSGRPATFLLAFLKVVNTCCGELKARTLTLENESDSTSGHITPDQAVGCLPRIRRQTDSCPSNRAVAAMLRSGPASCCGASCHRTPSSSAACQNTGRRYLSGVLTLTKRGWSPALFACRSVRHKQWPS